MRKRTRPDVSSEASGPDGPARRTQRRPEHAAETYEQERPLGRNRAMIDEESAWLSAHFFEPEETAR
jgi:hypothetical protein